MRWRTERPTKGEHLGSRWPQPRNINAVNWDWNTRAIWRSTYAIWHKEKPVTETMQKVMSYLGEKIPPSSPGSAKKSASGTRTGRRSHLTFWPPMLGRGTLNLSWRALITVILPDAWVSHQQTRVSRQPPCWKWFCSGSRTSVDRMQEESSSRGLVLQTQRIQVT